MQEINLDAIGKRIKELRLDRGVKAKNLAEKTYCEPSQISRLESGEAAGRLEKLVLVANALEVDVRELVEAGIKDQ